MGITFFACAVQYCCSNVKIRIGLITVFYAIMAGRQRGQKLEWFYRNLMANNIFQKGILQIAILKY